MPKIVYLISGLLTGIVSPFLAAILAVRVESIILFILLPLVIGLILQFSLTWNDPHNRIKNVAIYWINFIFGVIFFFGLMLMGGGPSFSM